MNRKRLMMIGVLALGAAFVVTGLFYRTLQRLGGSRASVPVVVAAADLPLGTRLDASVLRVTNLPVTDLPVGVFRNSAELVGRGVIVAMSRNEPILEAKLAPVKAGAGLPPAIPEGMRAVSVKVNDVISVAGFVAPGTRVDVLLTGNPTRDNDPGKVMTTTVLENVQVLAAGPKLEPNSKGEPQNVPVITLLVTPEQAQKLTLAATQGKIQLSLRNPLDLQEASPATVINASLYGKAPEKPAARTASAPSRKKQVVVAVATKEPYEVETLRGDKTDKREITKF